MSSIAVVLVQAICTVHPTGLSSLFGNNPKNLPGLSKPTPEPCLRHEAQGRHYRYIRSRLPRDYDRGIDMGTSQACATASPGLCLPAGVYLVTPPPYQWSTDLF